MKTDGLIIYSEELGSGEPIILMHGNGEDGSVFEFQRDFLASFMRVITVDTRGHGSSPRGDDPFTFDTFAEDLLRLLDSMGIASAHLLGFSDGGNIAMTFALKYPERVKSMILNGANMFPNGMIAKCRLEVEQKYLSTLFDKTKKDEREMLHLMARQPKLSPKKLSKLSIPTLILVGDDDMIDKNHTRMMHNVIKGSKLVTLTGSHFILRENHEEYNKAVKEFLDGLA